MPCGGSRIRRRRRWRSSNANEASCDRFVVGGAVERADIGVDRPADDHQRALALLDQAIAAQGGEEKLKALRSVSWHASGYRNELEQSERPEGPYLLEFDDITEVHDHVGGRIRSTVKGSVPPFQPFELGYVADRTVAASLVNGNTGPARASSVAEARETLALSPERILLTAAAAADVTLEAPTTIQSLRNDVIRFTLDGAPVRLLLNPYTHLPTAFDYSGPLARTGYWRFLGDVTMRTSFSFWWLAKGGIHFPLQSDTTRNGLPDNSMTIRNLTIDGGLNEAELTIPPALRTAAATPDIESVPLIKPTITPIDLAPGVVMFPGSWNVTLVRQDDGVVIIEAPISSGYSAQVLAEAKRRFPGVPVKAVVTTSDLWPHLAGIREYAAAHIPIFCLDLNVPALRRVAEEGRTSRPDTLFRHPAEPVFRAVSTATALGTGRNRLMLYPIRGETSERQMMAYFPELHLLYGSDPFQQGRSGEYSFPQTVGELVAAVDREHLQPQTFFMMHIGPTPWSSLGPALADAKKKDSPPF